MPLPRSFQQRQAIARRWMTPGSAGGRSNLVAAEGHPLVPLTVVQTVDEVAEFSSYDAVALTTSGSEPTFVVGQHGGHGGLIDEGTLFLRTAGSTSTVLTVYVNNVSIGTVTYASGDTTPQTDALTPTWVAPGDRVSVRVTTAGTGAKGLSAFVPIKG